jgi:hypothetical protein
MVMKKSSKYLPVSFHFAFRISPLDSFSALGNSAALNCFCRFMDGQIGLMEPFS